MVTTSRESTAAFPDWEKAIRILEIELEERIRTYFGGTSKQRENAAALSAMQQSGNTVQLSSSAPKPPPFDPAHFIYFHGTRDARVEFDATTH